MSNDIKLDIAITIIGGLVIWKTFDYIKDKESGLIKDKDKALRLYKVGVGAVITLTAYQLYQKYK